MKRITAVCLSSTIQRTVSFKGITINQVNRSDHYGVWASGKAVNAARVLNQLSPGSVRVVCPLGEENATGFTRLALHDSLEVSPILIPGRTRECWTVLDSKAGTTTELVVGEPDLQRLSEGKVDEILDAIAESLSDSDALLLAGSRPKIFPDTIVQKICDIAVESSKPVMVDLWGRDLKSLLKKSPPAIVKINEEEFLGTFNEKSSDATKSTNATLKQATTALKDAILTANKKYGSIFIVTRGQKSTLAVAQGKLYEVESEKITKVVNTTACGDAFSAGFLHEYLLTEDVKTALEKAVWCAARNAQNECPGSIE